MASKNVAFDTIPSSIRKPGKYFEFNTRMAVRNLPGNLQRVLLIGQKLDTGSQASLDPVSVFSDIEARDLFGAGSQLHLMVQAALTCNSYITLDCIALDDSDAGLAASSAITISGVSACAGSFHVNIGRTRVSVSFGVGVEAADIVGSMATQINKIVELPVVASVETPASLKLLVKNKGEVGNSLGLSALIETLYASGLELTFSPFVGGANNPDISDALAVVFAAGHNVLVSPYLDVDNVRDLRDHIDSVSNSMEQRGAVGIIGTNKTLAQSTTIAKSINSGRISLGWHPKSVCPSGEIAAAYAAIVAFEEDPARPLNTLAMRYLDETPVSAQPGRMEQEAALHNGVTPFEIVAGGVVQIVRAITTYTLDPQGIEDVSLLDLTTIRTLDYVRKSCRERIALRFPREKLSERTPKKVRSELLDVLGNLEDLEIVECVEENKPMLIIERDLQDANRLNAAIPADVVNGLHVFAGRIDLLL